MNAFGVFADQWAPLALAATWQLAALVVAALICERLFRLRQPRVRHALWWFVLVAPLTLAPGRAALERRDATVAIIVPESVGRALAPERAAPRMAPPVSASVGEEVASAPRAAAMGSRRAEAAPVAASAHATPQAASWWEQVGLVEALFALWVAGVLVFGLRLLAGHRCVRRMLSESAPVAHAGALEALAALQAEAGLPGRIPLRLSAAIGAPLLYGLRRPVVLIPRHWLESLSDAEMRALLAHEVAHVKRRDCFANLLQRLAEVPLFFHPGAWFASRRITGGREELADAWALARSGDPATYARSLAAAAERANARLAVASVGVAENKSTLCRRVEEIMDGKQRRRMGRPAVVALGAILLATAVAAAMVVTEVAESQVEPGSAACRPALVLENGQPASWATVTLLVGDPAQKTVVADGEGIADIDLSQLEQPVRFFAESGDRTQQALIMVDLSGGAGEEFTVVLHPLGRATGEVLDAHGQGVPGVAVELTPIEPLDGKAAIKSDVTDEQGRYEISGLIRGLYYDVQAYQGAKNSPTRTWSSRPFKVAASDGWFNVDVMVPAPQPDAARPDGARVKLVVSGTTDEWYDEVTGRWLRAKEAIDPYNSWARVPHGARWIWRAGRTSAEEERHGATVEFRRRFSIDRPADGLAGFLTVSADDHALIRLNGEWLGQCAEFLSSRQIALPTGLLQFGQNELHITLRNHEGGGRDFYNPAGVSYCLEVIDTGLVAETESEVGEVSGGSVGLLEMRGEAPAGPSEREALIFDAIELKHVPAGRLCHLFGGTLVGEPGADEALSSLLPRNRPRADAGTLVGLGGGGRAGATSRPAGPLRDLLPHGIVSVTAFHYESGQLLVQGTPDAITKLRGLIRQIDRAPQRLRLTAVLYPGKLKPEGKGPFARLPGSLRAETVTVETVHLIPAVLVFPAAAERSQMVLTVVPMVHPDGTVTIESSHILPGVGQAGSSRVNVLSNGTWLQEWGSGDAHFTLAMTVSVLPEG